MSITLNAEEARIIGCLIEKSVVTPDQYPLTLNALTNACNQKSGRDPVMKLSKADVQRHCRLLSGKGLLRIDENFRSGVEKYSQGLCSTRFSQLQLDEPEVALICALLLRGPQTPGELRTHTRRLYDFADNAAVTTALTALVDPVRGPLVQVLPRTPGRRDAEYMHRLSGPIDEAAYAAREQTASSEGSADRVSLQSLAERVTALETELDALKLRLTADN